MPGPIDDFFSFFYGNADPTSAATSSAVTGPLAALRYATGNLGYDDAGAVDKAAQQQLGFQQKQFDVAQQAGAQAQAGLDPYAQAGTDALAQQRALAGLDGPEAQQRALAMIQQSPGFMASVKSGEDAILANASATGGLRGGNVQAALAQYRPQMLDQYINNAYAQFGGLAGAGQQAASQQGAFGLNGAGMQADILGLQGQTVAGNTLGQQQAMNSGRDRFLQLGAQGLGAAAQLATGI